MANDLIPNSFQTPNAYVDRFMYLLTAEEWKVITYAARRIFGFQKRQDRISQSQFIHGTVSTKDGSHLDHGTGLSKPAVIRALDSLQTYRILIKIADNDTRLNEGILYELQLDSNQIDLAGLIERANTANHVNLRRTQSARSKAAEKSAEKATQSVGLTGGVVSGTDGGVVSGTDGGVVSGTDGGVVSGTDTQNQGETQGNPEETKSLTNPIWEKSVAYLHQAFNGTYAALNPILVAIDENPHKFTVLVGKNQPGLKKEIEAAVGNAVRDLKLRRTVHISIVTDWPGITPLRRVSEVKPTGDTHAGTRRPHQDITQAQRTAADLINAARAAKQAAQ